MTATATWGHDMANEIIPGDILFNMLTHTYLRVVTAPTDGHVTVEKVNVSDGVCERWPEARVRRQCRVYATAPKGG